jgi:FtsP/CotA-like multicopper oxidase with cupredoxin domain
MHRRNFLGTLSSLSALTMAPTVLSAARWSPQQPSGTQLRFPSTWNGSSMLMPALIQRQIWSDATTSVIGVGGYPGQTIELRSGDRLRVQFHNMLSEPLAIHWHGMDVPADMDGHPMDQFVPNAMRTYAFDVQQRAGMYFYHSHAHGRTASQVYQGLYGLVRVRDAEEDALGLPTGEFEVPLVIQDVRVNAQRQLVYQPDMIDRMEGHLGNVALVNGTPDAYLPVKRAWYRLRLVNASNARIYHIAFSDDRPFHVIGSDGGLLASAVQTTMVPLAPGERYDILVDLTDLDIGSSVTLVSKPYPTEPGHMGSPLYPQGRAFDLVRLDRIDGDGPSFQIPERLSSIERYEPSQAVRTRSFELAMTMSFGMVHTINGKLFDMSRIDERIRRGDLEIWEFVNKDGDMTHPMHLHGGQFQIISRNGSTEIPAWERGWKDTFIVHPNERIHVAVRFDHYTGVFLVHCHNLEHEDEGMMLNYEVTTPSSVHDHVDTLTAWYAPREGTIHVRSADTTAAIVLIDDAGRVVHTVTSAERTSDHMIIPADRLANGSYTLCVGRDTARIVVVR